MASHGPQLRISRHAGKAWSLSLSLIFRSILKAWHWLPTHVSSAFLFSSLTHSLMIIVSLWFLDLGLCVSCGNAVVYNPFLFWCLMVFHLQMSRRLHSYPGFEVFKQRRPLYLCVCVCMRIPVPSRCVRPSTLFLSLSRCQITMATCWNVNTLL